MSFFKGREILITGGTGTLGKELIRQLLTDHRPHGVRVYSRDELKQWQLRAALPAGAPVALLVGDVRDARRLHRAMEGVQVVIHAAALKQVGSCEDNPLEAVKTNVHGAENILDAALDCGVERVMNVSTDKAVKPVNLYGATKMAAEKLFIQGNVYSGRKGTLFSCCRYGNVLGSRGSVAHVFKAQTEAGLPLTITHKAMTRFWITVPRVAAFLLARVADMRGGEIFVPKMKSMGVYDMAMAMGSRQRCECHPERQGTILCPWCDGTLKPEMITPTIDVTGIRQGEKLHESLFAAEEFVVEHGDHYQVFPSCDTTRGRVEQWELTSNSNPNGELGREDLLSMMGESPL